MWAWGWWDATIVDLELEEGSVQKREAAVGWQPGWNGDLSPITSVIWLSTTCMTWEVDSFPASREEPSPADTVIVATWYPEKEN